MTQASLIKILTVFCLVLISTNAFAAKLYPKGSPVRAIQDLDARLEKFRTGKNLTKKDKKFNEELKKDIVHGTFDIRELAKRAMAKHWKGLSSEQQDHLIDIMTSLMEKQAVFAQEQSAARSKQGGKYNVRYRGSKYLDPEKNRAMVYTRILVPSENVDIAVNYKVIKIKKEWMIYDIILDEASLVANYKYQFNAIITKHGYPELLRRMEEKLQELEKKTA